MADPTTADLPPAELARRIRELEAENRSLRDRVPHLETPHGSRRAWGWTLLATVLITLGALLAPVALVSSWARVALTDTDRFVAAYAPLAEDPQIRVYLTDQIVDVINEQIDIPQITDDVIEGITELGTGPAATQALELLKGPAASGIQSLIRSGVTNFITSDAFADVWESALRVSHTQVVALLGNDPDAAITIGSEGEIGVQLGPIVEAVKTALVDQGIDLAAQIPAVDRVIVVAQSDALPSVQLAYGLAIAAGTWLPWVAILLLAAGVLVARRRAVALIWAAAALAVAMIASLIAFEAGNLALVSAISPSLLPAGVAGLLYETVATDMRATAGAVLVLAVVVIVVAWTAGPFDLPRRLRAFASEGAAAVRGAAERRGITTGRTGEWIFARRGLIRGAVAVIGAAVVLLVRPLTPALTIWTLVIAVLVLAIVEVVQRPVVPTEAIVDEHRPDEHRPVVVTE